MLVKKFRQTGPDVIILIVIILLISWAGSFFHPDHPADLNYDIKPMPLFGFMLNITGINNLFGTLIGFLLAGLVSFLLVNFNTSVFFISERTFLPALIYILLTSIFPREQTLTPVLPASVFLILGFRRIMDSYRVQGTAFSLFDAGMLISIGSLFYAGLIWFGLLLIFGIAYLRTGNTKELMISLLGLATPIFILYGFFYVTGKDMDSLMETISYNLFIKDSHFHYPRLTIAVLLILGVAILIRLIHLLSGINAKKIKSRKTFILLFWTLIITATVYTLFKPVSVEIYWLAAIPPTYFLSHYFVFSRNRYIPEIILISLFAVSAASQIVNFVQ